MKREKVYVDERRERIRDILREKSQVRVEALAEELKVSVITIRRDLQYLEEQKQLIRVYGGAVAVREQGEQTDEIQLYRDLIARYAASLVEDGDTLFLNTSRNVRQILRYITKKNVTVITNNGRAIDAERPGGKCNPYRRRAALSKRGNGGGLCNPQSPDGNCQKGLCGMFRH